MAKQHLAVARSVQTGKAPAVPAGWRLHGDLCGISLEKELSPTSSLQQHKGFETLYLGKQDGFGVSYHFQEMFVQEIKIFSYFEKLGPNPRCAFCTT